MPLRLPLKRSSCCGGAADTSYRVWPEQRERGAYRQTRQNMIYFGSSRADTEAYIGRRESP